MMLSRTGRDSTPLSVAGQTDEGRRAPWGCAAGAPYRGTASPPPPPPEGFFQAPACHTHRCTHQSHARDILLTREHWQHLEEVPQTAIEKLSSAEV